ncbi:MAG: diguanylate cyclase [Planctomycetota bacterium]
MGEAEQQPDAITVRQEQARLLHSQLGRGLPLDLLVGGVVAGVVATATGMADVFIWWASLTLLAFLRYRHCQQTLRLRLWKTAPARAVAFFGVGAIGDGLLWGSVLFLIDPAHAWAEAVAICAMSGVAVASIAAMTQSGWVFPAYLSAMMLPALYDVSQPGGWSHNVLLAMIALFGLFLLRAFARVCTESRENIQLQLDKDAAMTELAAANRRIDALSKTDQLTGIANRRGFDVHVAEEWRRAARRHEPVGLLLMDIDRFKLFNDSAGHQAGDECLRRIASALQTITQRSGDLVARFGGEEFIVVLPGADEAAVARVAELARAAVARERVPRPDAEGHVTVSIGAASGRPGEGESVGQAVLRADRSLYAAKLAGRDRIIVADAEPAVRRRAS